MADTDKIPSEDTVKLSRLVMVSHMFEELMRRETRKNGSRTAYTPVLRTLSITDGIPQQDLSRITRLRPPTISVTVHNMEKDGLIERMQDSYDGRVSRIRLTEKGRALNEKMLGSVLRTEEICLDGVTDEEIKQLNGLLLKIYKNLLEEVGADFFYEEGN
ncbi:MAG: MarR family transcriptional regulator [Eubacterium sp.]|nr:MarR family transcriptional regulator [Eubacterium sp.]